MGKPGSAARHCCLSRVGATRVGSQGIDKTGWDQEGPFTRFITWNPPYLFVCIVIKALRCWSLWVTRLTLRKLKGIGKCDECNLAIWNTHTLSFPYFWFDSVGLPLICYLSSHTPTTFCKRTILEKIRTENRKQKKSKLMREKSSRRGNCGNDKQDEKRNHIMRETWAQCFLPLSYMVLPRVLSRFSFQTFIPMKRSLKRTTSLDWSEKLFRVGIFAFHPFAHKPLNALLFVGNQTKTAIHIADELPGTFVECERHGYCERGGHLYFIDFHSWQSSLSIV